MLAAIEKEYGGDEARIRAEVTQQPEEPAPLRASATAPRRPTSSASCDWLGLEDMFELYGSTEAAISTFRKKGDPRGCVGEITDADREDPERARRGVPARRARRRRQDHATTPRRSARSAASRADTGALPGLLRQPGRRTLASTATASTTRATSATSLERDGKRFLFFDGRTDDWIRKDGENFSALQVARLVQEHPDVVLAAAYGVPCAVSDELVMVGAQAPRRRARSIRRRSSTSASGQVTRRRHGPQVVPRLRAHRRRVRVHADARRSSCGT